MWPEEQVSLKDMLDSFTYNGAVLNFLENVTGSIEVGKSADMIVIDRDIFEIPETEICEIKVLKTIFRGQEVFSRE
jgi:predicted amidohydrolase YtcJ